MSRETEATTDASTAPTRKIIHIDMDAFYASVEQRDDPALRGRPLAVGGSRERGVVAAASYEARVFGVRSAMPSVTARRLCPDLVFVKPRFDVYKAVSAEIQAVFSEHTPIVEPVSLDEAYLDVTENLRGLPTATAVARAIRAEILARTGLVASAGVSYNKFLAKVASDYRKPDALFVITPAMGPAFVEALPIGRFHGVGPVTEAKMKRLGILTGGDLRARSLAELQAVFGSASGYYHGVARGIDERPVRAHRIRKSVGAETTFSEDTTAFDVLAERLQPLLDKVWTTCAGKGVAGRTVTLKLKFSDFEQITRARSLGAPVASREAMAQVSLGLLRDVFPLRRSVRLIGVSLSGLDTGAGEAPRQLGLAV
ncbi:MULTISPECIES: DNA polymerase IV [unclassified Methylobacterium]|uniref:DNA polymerase IV n=1 Tax=unclassified Methylobacterium TaxID=2615210 RepID=UPI0006F76ABA|nr:MULTISPECIES: DNA polymerase IV [unclassified Methylobacterium]KQO65866.1 DNA polymerase IV [Methylobacterium sp. Leaf87]KQP64026.1 DNA polymerase IV [Methylobacterium sp. Leaf112]